MFSHLKLGPVRDKNGLCVSVYLYDSEIDIMSIKLNRNTLSKFGLRKIRSKLKRRLYGLIARRKHRLVHICLREAVEQRELFRKLLKSQNSFPIRFIQRYVAEGRLNLYKYLEGLFFTLYF